MGLFGRKKKMSADDMAMQAAITAIDVIGKFENFEDADNNKAITISIGYFYGFLTLLLNGITRLDTANAIIVKSMAYLAEATKEVPEFANVAHSVKTSATNALKSMKSELKKHPEDPFMGVAVDYLKELYNDPPSVDLGDMLITAKNMRLLYGAASDLTTDVKIVK